jgi:hypothetical protein
MHETALLTADSGDEKFILDHVTHFINTRCAPAGMCFTQEEKERYYKLWTDNEVLMLKLYGTALSNSPFFLPVALRNGVDSDLVKDYKRWLEQQ